MKFRALNFIALCLPALSLFHSAEATPLKGIVISDREQAPQDVEGIFFDNIQGIRSLQKLLEVKYIGETVTVPVVEEIKDMIQQMYHATGKQLAYVFSPNSSSDKGVLTFIVKEGTVGEVVYPKTRWFSERYLQKILRLKSGDVLDLDRVENKLAWVNRNGFQKTSVILSPGTEVGITDVRYVTKERFPWQFYLGTDNTGTKYTQQGRIMAGFNWGNVFRTQDTLSFQYTTSPDSHQFKSYLVRYVGYTSWKHEWQLYGNYGVVHPHASGAHEGKNAQGSFRYSIPFKPLFGSLRHQLTWGLDYKWINSNLFFLSTRMLPFGNQPVTLTQTMLGYRLTHFGPETQVTFDLECFGSPIQFLPHQTNHAYRQLRPHSLAKYFYGRSGLSFVYRHSTKLELIGVLRGQGSTAALLPSEQFGLGGYDTVRGYQERSFNADNAVCFNGEFHTPPVSFKGARDDRFYFVGFFDAAYGRNVHHGSSVRQQEWLLGVGPGLRYNIATNFTARFDYGFQLHHIFGDHHSGRCHFGLTASY